MARISYDEQTAAAYKAVREVPRDGLSEWREAVRRHLRPLPGMTLVDIGAGTGAFAAAFNDWFDISVVAVEPSAAMRDQIARTPAIQVLEGNAGALPLPDESADAAWLSLVIQHIPDLGVAAHEIRRVLRPGAPVLIRAGMSGTNYEGIENVRWFPETARTVDTFPSVKETCNAFAAAGFRQEALEQVRETYPTSLADFLGQVDTLRAADTTMRGLTEDEFLRGKERLRRTVRDAEDSANPETEATGSTSWCCADRSAEGEAGAEWIVRVELEHVAPRPEGAALDLGDHGWDPGDLRAVYDSRAELCVDHAQMAELRAARKLRGPVKQRKACRGAAAARRAVDLAVGEHRHVALHEGRAVGDVLPEDHAVDVAKLRLERVDDVGLGLDRRLDRPAELDQPG
jgi:SAM-dependent methyltransferase